MHPTSTPRIGPSLRAASNIIALLVLAIAIDWGIAWWRGSPPYACTGVLSLISDSGLTLIGMTGWSSRSWGSCSGESGTV
jgi:hypothetical protein